MSLSQKKHRINNSFVLAEGRYKTYIVCILAGWMILGGSTAMANATVTTVATSSVVTIPVTLQGSYSLGTGDSAGAMEEGFYLIQGTAAPGSNGAGAKFSSSGYFSPGPFQQTVSGLNPGTKYYYQAFINRGTSGPSYGSWQSFTTASAPATTVPG